MIESTIKNLSKLTIMFQSVSNNEKSDEFNRINSEIKVLQENYTSLFSKNQTIKADSIKRQERIKNIEDEIKNWKQTIANSHVKLIESETYPLTSLSQRLISGDDLNEQLKHIEVHLGIQPNHYNHLFDVEVVHEKTSDEYDAQVLDDILKGEHTKVVDEFRRFLDKPDFSWEVLRNKDEFRNRILEQVQLLGEAGYGAMAYPPEYGGTGNMPAYASIFEHLMFVDGSLAVKFGVQFGM